MNDFEIMYQTLMDNHKNELLFGDCVSEHTAGEILHYKSRGDALRRNQIIRPKIKRQNRRFYSLADLARYFCNQ